MSNETFACSQTAAALKTAAEFFLQGQKPTHVCHTENTAQPLENKTTPSLDAEEKNLRHQIAKNDCAQALESFQK